MTKLIESPHEHKKMDEIWNAKEMAKLVQTYRLDTNTSKGKIALADEWLAKSIKKDSLPAQVWQKIAGGLGPKQKVFSLGGRPRPPYECSVKRHLPRWAFPVVRLKPEGTKDTRP